MDQEDKVRRSMRKRRHSLNREVYEESFIDMYWTFRFLIVLISKLFVLVILPVCIVLEIALHIYNYLA